MGVDAEMFVKLNRKITEEELKKKSYIFGSIFKDHLWLRDDFYKNPLDLIDKIEGDRYGEGFEFSEIDGSIIKVPLICRYYSPGYARGPIHILTSMADFLERLFPDGQVYYGGDSSGIRFEIFDRKKRDEYLNFAAQSGHDSYNKYFSGNHTKYFCPNCKEGMTQFGWKGKLGMFTCIGCGWNINEISETEIKQGF